MAKEEKYKVRRKGAILFGETFLVAVARLGALRYGDHGNWEKRTRGSLVRS